MKKQKKIKEQLEKMENSLANAEDYIAQNINVEVSSWLHTDDWRGKSGHPLWMKNFMIPTTKKGVKKKQKALEKIDAKSREKLKQRRKLS